MAAMPQIRAKVAQLRQQRADALRTAAQQTATSAQAARQACLDKRSRWAKLRNDEAGCPAAPK